MKKCSKCLVKKPIKQFLMNRTSGPYPYRLNFCNECRYKQICKAINKDSNKYLKHCFGKLKTRAKRTNIHFDLTLEYFNELFRKQKEKCFYTEEKMDMRVGKGSSWDAFTVDKVIPNKGYIKGNIVFCRKRINTSKHLFSLMEMKKYMPLWYKKIIKTEWIII